MPKYFHMSPTVRAPGQKIHGNNSDKVDPRIEAELEARRPPEALSRRDAVFCLKHTDFTICGVVSPGYIYLVEPSGEPQGRDFTWVGEMQKALLRIEYPQYEEIKKYPEWNDDFIEKCCTGYWSGACLQMPGCEFLAPSCTVIQVVSDELVDPKGTKGGWQSSSALS